MIEIYNLLPFIYQYFFYETVYSPLYNNLIITFSVFFKILYCNHILIQKILELSTLNAILYYTIDTICIFKKNGIKNIFILHHIFSIYILLKEYIFIYDVYISYVLLFFIELSGASYSCYLLKLIRKNSHIFVYVPLRFLSNIILVYFFLYEMKYSYTIEYIFNLISFVLLFMFNIGGILKSLNFI